MFESGVRVLLADRINSILVDPEDVMLATSRKWRLSNRGYAAAMVKVKGINRVAYLHRLILPLPKGITVDHANGQPLDNRRSNLRPATQSQQVANTRTSSRNRSGFKGVSWDTNRNRWVAYVGRQFLGRFSTAEEAAMAYDVAAQRTYGEFAKVNFP